MGRESGCELCCEWVGGGLAWRSGRKRKEGRRSVGGEGKCYVGAFDLATEEEIVGVGETIERRWKGDKVGPGGDR